MFFSDSELTLKKKAGLRALPSIPDTGWKPPQYFPNLSGASVIAFDTETKELDWDHGPGWARGPKGHIVGVSVAAKDRRGNTDAWYFPVRHEVEREYNLDPSHVFGWLRETLQTPHIPKVGANLYYDIGWLTEENIFVEGDLFDVQYAESLLDEEAFVNLDDLGMKYAGRGKETNLLYQWITEAYRPNKTAIRGEIHRSPPRLVGPYAEDDARLPIEILEKQWPLLVSEGLIPVYRMECNLIRLYVRMRRSGVRVNVPYAEQLYGKFAVEIQRLKQKLNAEAGFEVNTDSGAHLARVFDQLGLKYPLTARGSPSFIKEFLESQKHPITDLIVGIRKFSKLNSTFIKGYLLEGNTNGRIYTTFHPLKASSDGEQSGAKTGRYSSEAPNLQNIPIRTKEGKMIRAAFIPDEGHMCWEKDDQSQIEYRMMAHHATGPGADGLRAEYNNDPTTDYHDKVYYAACPIMGWNPKDEEVKKEKRRPIKNTNFGLIYGQTAPSLAAKMNMSKSEAAKFFAGYHQAAPWVKPTMASIAQEVQDNGFIRTIMGRRVRFQLWEPAHTEKGQPRLPGLPFDDALYHYGPNIKRAYDYRGVNYKFQGGAADVMKKGMELCYTEGVFDVTGDPKLTVHDELDFSVIDDSPAQREAYRYMRHLLENAIPLRVPVRVDFKRGAHWGEAD